ncbi:MAG: ABC transporter ATP-binding protein [Candidatus Nanopelagicales bacterium]|nr:ABC transporter ATP-binding protein [Candidatus Nanopelagicales bacterium]
MSQNKIEVSNLTLKYGDALAVDNVSFSLAHGECLTILGANGAGKSSIGKSLAGLLPPSSGTITLDGDEIQNLDPYLIAGRGLAYLPEGRAIFPTLSVEENLMLGARKLAADPKAAVEHAYELFSRLGDRRKQIARTLSGGEQQMLAVAKALITEPQVLVVDELSLGLAPLIIADIYTALAQAREKNNVTIVLIEQYIDRALSFADRAMLMVHGHEVWNGPADSNADGIVRGFLSGETAA